MATLPPELLANLENAALTCDMIEVERFINEIRVSHTAIADALSALAWNFDYGKIATFIAQAQP